MARVDIRQYGRIDVVRRPKQSRVAIVSEAAGELLIEYPNEIGGSTLAVNPVADAGPRDGLQVRHHKSGRGSFSTHIGAKYPNSSLSEIEEIVEIAPDRSRRPN